MDSVDFFFLFAFFLFFFSVFPDLSLIFLSHSNSNNIPQYSGDSEEAAAVGPVVSASEATNHSRPLGSPAAGAAPPSSPFSLSILPRLPSQTRTMSRRTSKRRGEERQRRGREKRKGKFGKVRKRKKIERKQKKKLDR